MSLATQRRGGSGVGRNVNKVELFLSIEVVQIVAKNEKDNGQKGKLSAHV
jgi:hypothetical protein